LKTGGDDTTRPRRQSRTRGARFSLVHDTKNGQKCTKWKQNVPNGHKISQMSVKYSKWPYYISTFSNLWPSKIYPNWDFWFGKKPSGNPEQDSSFIYKPARQRSLGIHT
jgi:hypothetical protein